MFVQAEERFLDVAFHRCRVGFDHLAFHASSREQLDEITNKLKKKEMTILYPNNHPFN